MVCLELPITLEGRWLGPGSQAFANVALSGLVQVERGLFVVGVLQPVVLAVRGFAIEDRLRVLVSTDTLVALDAGRNGGDLDLTSDLSAALVDQSTEAAPMHDQVQVRMAGVLWLQALDSVGGDLALTIRVPMLAMEGHGYTRGG